MFNPNAIIGTSNFRMLTVFKLFATGAFAAALAPVRALLRALFDVFGFVVDPAAACEVESAPTPPAAADALLAAIAAVYVAKFIYLSRNRKSSRTDHTCIFRSEKY